MSAALRQAVRDLLHEIELFTPIVEGSQLAVVKRELRAAERDDAPAEPVTVNDLERQNAVLVQALNRFKKMSGHFVGCSADKDGQICSESCRHAQAALDPRIIERTNSVIARYERAIRGLEGDKRELQRRIVKVEADAGLVKRPRGRPRKHPKVN